MAMPTHASPSSSRYYVGRDVHRDTTQACVYDARRRVPWYHTAFSAHDAGKLRRFIDRVRTRFGEPRCG